MQLKDFNTLAEAQAYTVTQPKLIHRDTMNSLLADAQLYVTFKAIAEDTSNPALQNMISAFLDSEEYNFMIGNPTGDRQIAALDSIISGGGPLATALTAIRPIILSIANPTTAPYANATLNDFAVAKDDQTRFKAVPASAINDKWLTLMWAGEFEAHRPSVYFVQGGKKRRLTNFPLIESAGTYECFVNNNQNLFVDNAYNAVV